MKILIYRTFPDILDIDSYNVQEIGLAKALIRLGHECDIIFYNGRNKDKTVTYDFESNGKKYSYKIYWLHGFNILKNGFMPSAKKFFKDYDIIQVHEYEQISSWKTYCRQVKPTVLYHGLYQSGYTKGYNLKCFVFDKLFFNRKKKSGVYENVVCLTKSEPAADFLRKKGFKRVKSVGVGLDADKFGDIDIAQRRLDKADNKKTRLLYVGKIEDRRNSLSLLDVFEELLKRGLDVELKIIGTGEKRYLNRFMKKAEPFIKNGTLVYESKVSQAEMPKEYLAADIFIFPSNYEIFGMVLLEAMYFGVPVISSYNGGSSVLVCADECAEQNGCIIDNFDMVKWADCIENVSKDKELLAKMSSNATSCIRDGFFWDKLAPGFIDAYKEAIVLRGKA